MKPIVFIILSLLLTHTVLAQETAHYATNQIIVKFKPTSDVNLKNCTLSKTFEHQVLDSLNRQFALKTVKLTGNKNKKDTYIFNFKTDQDIAQLIRIYEQTGVFDYVEPNYMGKGAGRQGLLEVFPVDTYFSRQWGLYNDGSFSLSPAENDADIDMELAWDVEQGSSSMIVAVLDSGLKLDHPDISARVWENTDETANGADDDDNGYIDDTRGWDFVNDDNDPTDDFGHGTNVAGIIGADANNNMGYTGVDWHSKLMICKILDENNSGYYSWWTEAIYYAVDNGAKVINMSVGGSGASITMQEAVDYAYDHGVVIVACMMNENTNTIFYPAGYQNTIAVGATNPNDERAVPFFWSATSGSNYGDHIDVVAPGNYTYGLNHLSDTDYNTYWGGTSQATPLVTGLSALLMTQDPGRTPDDIRNIIRSTAEDQVGNPSEDVEGFDVYYGFGRVNAHQALLYQTSAVTDYADDQIKLMVYPNPSSGDLYIKSDEAVNICIKDLLGKTVYSSVPDTFQTSFTVDISSLPSGVYFVMASDSAGNRLQSQKVVKR